MQQLAVMNIHKILLHTHTFSYAYNHKATKTHEIA